MDSHARPKLLYPSMVIAAIAVTVFSLLGIATLTGALPFAHSQNKSDVTAQADADNDPKIVADQKLAYSCSNCGVVESVTPVEVKGHGSGLGAVAGGIAGGLLGNGIGQGNGRTATTILGAAGGAYAGNEIEKTTKKHTSYRIRVRMSDDSIHTLYQHDIPNVSAGDRVKVINGGVVQQS